MHFIFNFGQFSDRFLFGPVFGQKSQNRTLSEKSDGLAALYVVVGSCGKFVFVKYANYYILVSLPTSFHSNKYRHFCRSAFSGHIITVWIP